MRILALLLLPAALLLPAPAAAIDACDDLWFTRNLLFHRAGHCFRSDLGRAVFGNQGCRTAGAELDPEQQALVTRVIARETALGCAVDGDRAELEVPLQELRKTLSDLPVATGTESACIGWIGSAVPLRALRHPEAPEIFSVRPGDRLDFRFEDEDGWRFVEVLRDEAPVGAGWTEVPVDAGNCETWAG